MRFASKQLFPCPKTPARAAQDAAWATYAPNLAVTTGRAGGDTLSVIWCPRPRRVPRAVLTELASRPYVFRFGPDDELSKIFRGER